VEDLIDSIDLGEAVEAAYLTGATAPCKYSLERAVAPSVFVRTVQIRCGEASSGRISENQDSAGHYTERFTLGRCPC
jgi:hypothetical protein